MFILLFLVFIAMPTQTFTVFDFDKSIPEKAWYVVNDVVMGGRSSASIKVDESGHGVFSGHVSLENNGGFASIRHEKRVEGVKDFTKAMIRVKGDGKSYQFRLRENSNDRHSYITKFETSGEWQVIEIPLSSLYPSWRGRKLDMPNFNSDSFNEICFLIANYKEEDFQLKIDWIKLE